MGSKKVALLFIGLLLPILVFVFLKVFGKNEFDVPLIHEHGVITKPTDCNISYEAPYVVHDSVMSKISPERSELTVLDFGNGSVKQDQLLSKFKPDVTLIREKDFRFTSEYKAYLKKCVMLIESPNSIVLLDKTNRIRGYYDGTDRDELDRLEAELNIILKKY